MNSTALPRVHAVLVTDFDGTLTCNEFYHLVQDHLSDPDADYWSDYRAGHVTHFDAMARYFAAIRADKATVVQAVRKLELDPRFTELATALQHAGWEIVVASAGSDWYIRQVLEPTGVAVTIHANPGYWAGGEHGLVLERPTRSPFYCPNVGIDKAGVVRDALLRSGRVAFAGDGYPDVPAAVLVPPRRRFARADCASELIRRGEAYRPFDRWAEVAEALLSET